MNNKWSTSGIEPSLKDMMNDPIVTLILKRDNLEAKDVWETVESAKIAMRNRSASLLERSAA